MCQWVSEMNDNLGEVNEFWYAFVGTEEKESLFEVQQQTALPAALAVSH